jgi:hypothetical protein
MQIKGSKYTIFGTHQIPSNLHFVSPLTKQNEKIKSKQDTYIRFHGRDDCI